MSATERLRAMLDERGVEWDYGITGATTTSFNANGVDLTFTPMRDGLVCSTILTPEQAIAATLGRGNAGRYVGLRQGKYWERTENSDYYCGGCGWKVTDHDSFCPECGGALHKFTLGSCNCSFNCTNSERTGAPRLPHFWTHDGTLHIELPKLPESISVRLPDQRDREVRSARTWQYTRGSGTYQKVYLVETSDDLIESWYPIGVYLNSKVAGDCAEALRGEVDGIQQFARVVELKVVDDG